MERLQYISQQNDNMTHLEGIQKACEAGLKWVQLRIKDKEVNEIIPVAKEAKQICDSFGALLTINDFPSIAKTVNAYAAHLGKKDLAVEEGRILLGDSFVIGGTANTIEDVEMHFNSGADYVGVGPFRFTTTKKKLSPVLGLEGYRKIMKAYSERRISIPVIAIGGIEMEDIKEIMRTGVYGIAVSGLIANAKDPKGTVEQILEIINASIYTTC